MQLRGSNTMRWHRIQRTKPRNKVRHSVVWQFFDGTNSGKSEQCDYIEGDVKSHFRITTHYAVSKEKSTDRSRHPQGYRGSLACARRCFPRRRKNINAVKADNEYLGKVSKLSPIKHTKGTPGNHVGHVSIPDINDWCFSNRNSAFETRRSVSRVTLCIYISFGPDRVECNSVPNSSSTNTACTPAFSPPAYSTSASTSAQNHSPFSG